MAERDFPIPHPHTFPGTFLVIDGIDGCGKSVQVKLLKEKLERRSSLPIILTKEPNIDKVYGREIYDDLKILGGLHTRDPIGFQSWYAINSRVNLKDIIIPALQNGHTVISDRFRSSMVYGAKNIEDIKILLRNNEMFLWDFFIRPDATFILDIPVKTAMERLKAKGLDFDEFEKEKFLKTVKENFLLYAKMIPGCGVINAEKAPEHVCKEIDRSIPIVMNKPLGLVRI